MNEAVAFALTVTGERAIRHPAPLHALMTETPSPTVLRRTSCRGLDILDVTAMLRRCVGVAGVGVTSVQATDDAGSVGFNG